MKIVPTTFYLKQASKLFSERERLAYEDEIAGFPERWPVISGTGGLRKARVAASGRGKRGGARLIYYAWISEDLVLMLHVYSKNDQDDLTHTQQKSLVSALHLFKESYHEKN
jgi:mRNA-degrading endonuclease RelE of RelBE toxin-antitoxin system